MDSEPTTESISIRINKKTLDKLRTYAKNDGTSLNSEISTLLAFDVEWNMPAAKSGWVPVPKDILIAIMDKLDEKEIEGIAANTAKNALRDLVLAMRGRYTVKNTLDVLSKRSRAAGFHCNEVEEDDEIHFIMQHGMGMKWSLYYKIFYDSALYDLGCKAKFAMTDNTITYTINKRDYK